MCYCNCTYEDYQGECTLGVQRVYPEDAFCMEDVYSNETPYVNYSDFEHELTKVQYKMAQSQGEKD